MTKSALETQQKFIVHYYAPADLMAEMANTTAEQKEESMKSWMAWKDKVEEHIVDFGAPMAGAFRLRPDGTESRSQSEVIGYSILQAKDMEEVKTVLKDHPHLQWSDRAGLEIFEYCSM